MNMIETLKDGAVRVMHDDGTYQVANPGSLWYSTIMMIATEVYKNGKWVVI